MRQMQHGVLRDCCLYGESVVGSVLSGVSCRCESATTAAGAGLSLIIVAIITDFVLLSTSSAW